MVRSPEARTARFPSTDGKKMYPPGGMAADEIPEPKTYPPGGQLVDDIPVPDDDDSKDKDNLNYGSGPQYWDDRYAHSQHQTFDWLRRFSQVEELIWEVTDADPKCEILHVGCGNSELTESMYDAGFPRIVNIDISAVAIEQMVARNNDRPEMSWLHMDATCMDFESDRFDLVLDKSLLDTLVCSVEQRAERCRRYVAECLRVLRPGGTFVVISFDKPSERQKHLEVPGFEVTKVEELPKARTYGSEHWLYVCRKVPPPVDLGQLD